MSKWTDGFVMPESPDVMLKDVVGQYKQARETNPGLTIDDFARRCAYITRSMVNDILEVKVGKA